MAYRDSNPKIDIFVRGKYECSTNWAKTCKEAKASFLKVHFEIRASDVTARKSK